MCGYYYPHYSDCKYKFYCYLDYFLLCEKKYFNTANVCVEKFPLLFLHRSINCSNSCNFENLKIYYYMSSHITIKDIAKAMGCAPSTVSRALNNSSNISPAVREAIQRYAVEHNYRPNEFALSLRNNRSNTIGVILPQIKHYFFASVLSGVERAAVAAGYNIMVAQSNEEYEREVSIIESFRKAKVCGVIASLAKGTMDYTHFRRLVEEEVPLVFYDRIPLFLS